jgi:homoserine kinase
MHVWGLGWAWYVAFPPMTIAKRAGSRRSDATRYWLTSRKLRTHSMLVCMLASSRLPSIVVHFEEDSVHDPQRWRYVPNGKQNFEIRGSHHCCHTSIDPAGQLGARCETLLFFGAIPIASRSVMLRQ